MRAKVIALVFAVAIPATAATFPLRQPASPRLCRSKGYAGQVTGRTNTPTRTGGDYAHCFTGAVTRVIDGDTIIVGTNRVRLAEIDAPEMKTPEGPASKKALSDLILHKTVIITWSRRGRYRRIIGQIYLADEWINLTMVEQGWARVFKKYSSSQVLAAAEQKSQAGEHYR